MALALYRKYRPRTFAEVIGQEHVTEPLSQALRNGRLNHAYLFSGPRGCGKTSSARILARSLNCEQGPTPEPCGTCASCRSLAVDGAGSIDVIEIDAASHGGVDDARELREKAFFAPASSRFKIYVIDEAHMVSTQGFNALLKLVEEPPEYVKFIFATTEPEKVLGTIRSRTHHYPFRLIPPATLRPYLAQLCEAEGVPVDPAVFPLVVRAGGGSARDSLSILDQLIAGAGPDGVGYARALALLGVTDTALIDEMCDALAAGDGAAAYATIDRVSEAGHDPRRFASDLLERLRDLIIMQQIPDAVAKGLIDGPPDQLERMTAQAGRLGPATLSRCADIVHNGLVEMRGTTAPRLLLELITARMLLPGAEDSTGALLQRLERMERRLTLGALDNPPAVRAAPAAPQAGASVPGAAGTPAPAASQPAPPSPPGPTTNSAVAPSAPGASAHAIPARPDLARSAATDPYLARSAPARSDLAGSAATGSAPTRVAVAQGAPTQGAPTQGAPTQVAPAQGAPAQVAPVQGAPARAVPATPPPSAGASAGQPVPAAAAPGQLSAAGIREAWPEVVGLVNHKSKKIAVLAQDAVVRDLDGQTVVLVFRFPAHARMVAAQPELLSEALYEVLGGRWQVRCEVGSDSGAPGSARSVPPAQHRPAQPAPAQTAAPAAPTEAPTQAAGPAPTHAAGQAPVPVVGQAPAQAVGQAPAQAAGQAPAPGAAQAAPASPVPPADDSESDWPEPARPGGSGAGVDARPAAPSQAAPGTRPGPPAPAAAGGADGGAGRTQGSGRAAGASAALAAARAAAAGGGRSAAGGGSAAGGRSAAAGGSSAGGRSAAGGGTWSDGSPAEEPPYDPDYDGPIRPGGVIAPVAAIEGFDPGDEPLDDVIDEKTARQSSEQQAVQLLNDAFGGTEKIGER
ncbi:MAG TPA: DNA polymerase III subunit gamma and tau [Actinoplanes sp.]|nr:DNA polymerase III subunit gamma and tau [Actinoplanes sp.]